MTQGQLLTNVLIHMIFFYLYIFGSIVIITNKDYNYKIETEVTTLKEMFGHEQKYIQAVGKKVVQRHVENSAI